MFSLTYEKGNKDYSDMILHEDEKLVEIKLVIPTSSFLNH